jgi:dipeptidase D
VTIGMLPTLDFPPQAVWRHFADICRIPRPSKHEQALRQHILQLAGEWKLESRIDAAGNLLVNKPGRAGRPPMALQAHLDMVCQQNGGTGHDFGRDPIRYRLRDGWLEAPDTTLGADNGLGVALMLAVLEDDSLDHGPLEALFTVDEESGMGGARGLAPDLLQSRLMLNLDTEQWGEFYLGCAGGLDVDVNRPGTAEPLPAGWEVWELRLGGLRGGHSGVDIHEGRGNAIKLLVRVLRDLERKLPLRLAGLRGGSARNALPREAAAVIALPADSGPRWVDELAAWQQRLSQELAGVEPSLRLAGHAGAATGLLSAADQAVWLASLHAAPHGVKRMSDRLPGVVETSNNLGIVDLSPEAGHCNLMVRSLIDCGSEALAEEIASLFSLSGTTVTLSGQYPGWAPDPGSPLLARCQAVHRREFGAEAQVRVIHAGLECGLIAAKYPGLDIVSLGPTIRGAHAPGEAVEIASVAKTWALLQAILRSS